MRFAFSRFMLIQFNAETEAELYTYKYGIRTTNIPSNFINNL